MKVILSKFSEVFEEPKFLSPQIRQDHSIALVEGVKGLRPYRYSTTHKDIIESLVDEMLQICMIQHNTSPFSSPVVLVKKKRVHDNCVLIIGSSTKKQSMTSSLFQI